MGLMIGEPSPYLYLTGYDYLRCYHKLYPGVDEERIRQTLELVGMTKHWNLKIKKYSTGMKQLNRFLVTNYANWLQPLLYGGDVSVTISTLLFMTAYYIIGTILGLLAFQRKEF